MLRGYTGDPLDLIGCIVVDVEVQEGLRLGIWCRKPLFVVAGSGQCLFGRDLMKDIQLDWKAMTTDFNTVPIVGIDPAKQLSEMLEEHKEVFAEGLGTYTGPAVEISVDPAAKPKFCAARQVPYAWCDAVDKELACLEEEGVIEPVKHFKWASPILAIPKSDGTVHICGDYKRTVNEACRVDFGRQILSQS